MKVNFFAPINDLGYGIHSYNTISEFEKRGHHITLIPPFNRVSRETEDIKRWLENRNSFDPNLPGIMIFNEEYLTQFCGRPRIGFPVFELEKFTPLQIAMLKSCDYLFTPTAWGKKVLEENIGKASYNKIHVVNEGFDPVIFPSLRMSDAEIEERPFTFIHVGKFEARKGTMQAIECFFMALEQETARLVMHIHNQFTNNYEPIYALLTRLGFKASPDLTIWRRAGLSIYFTQPMIGQDGIAALYKEADCGLFPTRAEGWGLPILECIASGVPAIVGAWTGQSEYLLPIAKEMSPFLLGQAMQQNAADNFWFFGDRGKWNVPTDSEIMTRIRYAFTNTRTFRGTSAWWNAVAEIRGYTWARAAAQLERALTKVLE
jgi:glycosyltransferase involved in cell wall biosynthesis